MPSNVVEYPVQADLLSAHFLQTCSYTDFIGAINQWNVPPGSYDTLSRWRVFGEVDLTSHVLEVACTTGFSSRELTRLTGCRAAGLDISAMSVELARYNAEKFDAGANITYSVEDGMLVSEETKYSHIVLGAAAGFFEDPVALVRKCTRLLTDGGRILASPFYVASTIPSDLVDRARGVFGITVTNSSYEDVVRPYAGLDVLYEEHFAPRKESDEELAHYCDSTIARFALDAGISDSETLEVARERLMSIKRMSNDLRPFQRWATLVLEFKSGQYPSRFVELF